MSVLRVVLLCLVSYGALFAGVWLFLGAEIQAELAKPLSASSCDDLPGELVQRCLDLADIYPHLEEPWKTLTVDVTAMALALSIPLLGPAVILLFQYLKSAE